MNDRPDQETEIYLPVEFEECQYPFSCGGYFNSEDKVNTEPITLAGLKICTCDNCECGDIECEGECNTLTSDFQPLIPLKSHHTEEVEGYVTLDDWVDHWYAHILEAIEENGRSSALMTVLRRLAETKAAEQDIHHKQPHVEGGDA